MHEPETPPPARRLDLASLLHKPAEIVVAGPGTPSPAPAAPPPAEVLPEADAPLPPPDTFPDDPPAPAPGRPRPRTAPPRRRSPPAARIEPVIAPPAPPDPADPAVDPAPESVPTFLREARRPPVPAWEWLLAGLLLLALPVQAVVAERDRLAARPALRPAMEALCGRLGCSLPVWHEPAAFTLVDRNVAPLPGQPGVLEVEVRLRNDARWPQALPAIELLLSTADGRASGQRRFLPAEYAPGRQGLLAPGQTLHARWLVAEPALPAETFHFGLH